MDADIVWIFEDLPRGMTGVMRCEVPRAGKVRIVAKRLVASFADLKDAAAFLRLNRAGKWAAVRRRASRLPGNGREPPCL